MKIHGSFPRQQTPFKPIQTALIDLVVMQDRDLKVERINTRAATIPFVIPKETSREAYTTLPTPSGSTIKVKPDSMTAEPQGCLLYTSDAADE